MRKRKGAALPLAVILCSFLLIVSFMISAFVLDASSYNIVSSVRDDRLILFKEVNLRFIAGEEITDTTYKWEIYDGEDNIKALAAYSSNDTLSFVSIYDFTHHKQLLYQTSNIYVTTVGDDQYLGGIVKIARGE